MHIMYIYCTNWVKVISCQEQIVKLLAVIPQKNKRISIFKILKAKSGMPEHKDGKKTYFYKNTYFFFLSFIKLCSNSASCNRILQQFLSCSLKAIIIAIISQKTLHWQSSKVTPSGMYHSMGTILRQ